MYEYSEDRPAFSTEEDFKKCLMYPNESEIDFLDYNNVDFRKAYEMYLNDRNNMLRGEFLNLIDDLD